MKNAPAFWIVLYRTVVAVRAVIVEFRPELKTGVKYWLLVDVSLFWYGIA